jgi:hypothetical protein
MTKWSELHIPTRARVEIMSGVRLQRVTAGVEGIACQNGCAMGGQQDACVGSTASDGKQRVGWEGRRRLRSNQSQNPNRPPFGHLALSGAGSHMPLVRLVPPYLFLIQTAHVCWILLEQLEGSRSVLSAAQHDSQACMLDQRVQTRQQQCNHTPTQGNHTPTTRQPHANNERSSGRVSGLQVSAVAVAPTSTRAHACIRVQWPLHLDLDLALTGLRAGSCIGNRPEVGKICSKWVQCVTPLGSFGSFTLRY